MTILGPHGGVTDAARQPSLDLRHYFLYREAANAVRYLTSDQQLTALTVEDPFSEYVETAIWQTGDPMTHARVRRIPPVNPALNLATLRNIQTPYMSSVDELWEKLAG